MNTELKSFIYTSIPDKYTVDNISLCIIRSRLSLYVVFNAKHIFDKYLNKLKKLDEMENTGNYYRNIILNDRLFYNHHLIFICCLVISSKIYMDVSYTNKSWAEVSNLSVKSINQVEMNILEILDYDIYLAYKNVEILYHEYGNKDEVQNFMKNNTDKKKGIVKTMFKIFRCFY